MRVIIVFLLALFLSANSFAQVKAGGTYKEYFQEGSLLFLEENYVLALENFQAAFEQDSSTANIHYKMGVCYLHSATQKKMAERFLAESVKTVNKNYKGDDYSEKSAPPLAHLEYGKALHINYKFDEAEKQYEIFHRYSGNDKDWKKKIDYNVAICENAKKSFANPVNIKISNVGDSINSIYPDYSPVLSADERMMIYTTRRPTTTGGLKDNTGYYNEDIVVSYKDNQGVWTSPVPISANINTSGMEASINLSVDGQTLILYRDGGDGNSGNIFYSTFDGKDWSLLNEFGSDVNTKYHESHACLSGDGHALFFTSDRPGGFGGSDIYRCLKLPNGKWSKALNMGPTINTEYDEDGAFIHPDGFEFFFSSKGHKTIGGFDIMVAILNDQDKFDNVTNMGYPINTTDDDVFYVTSPDGKRAYFSSDHEGGFGEKDIYILTIPEAKEKPLALFKGQIIPADGEQLPEDIIIAVTDKATGEVIGTYRPKLVNGVFSTILPPGKEYNFSYQTGTGEEFYNEDVFVSNELTYQEIKREVNLEPVKLIGKVKAKSTAIKLNAVVLDNPSSKKPVSGAKLTLAEAGGTPSMFDANEKGKYEGIELAANKKYTLFAETGGKKSAIADISTVGAKSGKVINQILYVEGKAVKAVSKDITLDVVVKNSKTKKAIANAAVTLSDADGNKKDLSTDDQGKISGVELSPDTKYTLSASSDGAASDPVSFNTNGIKGAKKISKTIMMATSGAVTAVEPETKLLPPSDYEFFFKYNSKDLDDAGTWAAFIDYIIEKSKKKSVSITIKASASKVPTIRYPSNNALAAQRATSLQDKIKEAVEAKGGNVKKLIFSKSSSVGGPAYLGDAEMRDKYEKFQYVKAKAK
jgi:WD40 repeat protein